MIPDYCKSESPGEETLFNLLKADPLTNDWVIFHSLHIARHVTKPKGEADFLILIPEVGFIVLEVKSHSHIDRVDGTWYFGKAKKIKESPFVQAETAMFSLRDQLNSAFPWTKYRVFLEICWFTDLNFEIEGPVEWGEWQALDVAHLPNAAASLLGSVRKGISHLREKVSKKVGTSPRMTLAEVEEVIGFLRPNFEFSLSEKQIRQNRQTELVHFLKEQYQALDLCSLMNRVIFNGPAGTGKTLLAEELAKRRSLVDDRVLLVCFNRLLADEVKSNLRQHQVTVATFDSLALSLAKIDSTTGTSVNLSEIQRSGYSALKVPSEEQYDFVIVDEAQDLFHSDQLGLIDKLLKDGLKKGKWVAFGDFNSQQIYGGENLLQLTHELYGDVPVASLTQNCRNTSQIGSFTESTLPKAPKWSKFRREGDNPTPKMFPIGDDVSITEVLDQVIDGLRAEKFTYDDIVVLSPSFSDFPEDLYSDSKYANKFVTAKDRQPGKIAFTSIAKFKGLDSACVIAMDLELLESWPQKDEYLYVLFTRARDRLSIMASTDASKMLRNSLGVD
jgi:hypothetical protein